MIDKEISDGARHGLWVRWETVQDQMLDSMFEGISPIIPSSTDSISETLTLNEDGEILGSNAREEETFEPEPEPVPAPELTPTE